MTTALEPQFAVSFPATLPALSIGDSDIRGTAEAYGAVHDVRSRALPALEGITKNQGLNDLGKVEAWTAVAESELPRLHAARAKIQADRTALASKLAQVEEAAGIALTTSPVERMDQWETGRWFAAQSPTKQQQLVEAMVKGEQRELRDSLLALPVYSCPLSGPMRSLFYAEWIAEHVDEKALTRIKDQMDLVNTVSRELSTHIAAFERAADRDRLRAKGIDIPKHPSEMSDQEKVRFIDEHGLEAWRQRLSA